MGGGRRGRICRSPNTLLPITEYYFGVAGLALGVTRVQSVGRRRAPDLVV